MRILEIATDRVRNLPDRTWALTPGLQILQGPNEAGKSALHEAIRIGLYGDATSTAAAILRAQRWGSAEGMRVRVRLDLPDGPWDIVRDFAEKKNVLIGPDGTRARGQQALDELLRRHLPLPTLESFLATACVRQDELAQVVASAGAKALRPLLEQHALSGGGVDLADLQKRLDRHLAELRRGVDKPAPRNPGRIAGLLDQQRHWAAALATLTQQVEAQTQAAERLAGLRQTLTATQEEATLKCAHLERHKAFQEATGRLNESQQRVGTAQGRLDRAAALTAALPGLATAMAQATAAHSAHEARLARAERQQRLSQEAEGLRTEGARLAGDLSQLDTVAATLVAHEAARDAIPLSQEELATLRAIPLEMARLSQDVQAADAERRRLGDRLANLDRTLAADRDRLATLATEQAAHEVALAAADARGAAATALLSVTEAIAARTPRLAHLRALQTEAHRLEAAGRTYAFLDAVDLSAFPALIARVAALRAALQHGGFEVRVTPRQPLTLTVQADEAPATDYPDQVAPLVIPAGAAVAVTVDGVLDLTVQNLGTAATELATVQEQLHRLLAALRCESPHEAEALLAARARAVAAAGTAKTQLQAALGTDTLEALETEIAQLQVQQEARTHALEALPPVDHTAAALRAALQAAAVEIAALQATERAGEQERKQLQAALAADPVGGTRDELTRKTDVLAVLHARLGADPAAIDALEAQLAACARGIADAETARATLLGGRTSDRMVARRDDIVWALAALETECAGLTPDALDAEALQAARTELQTLAQAAKTAEVSQLRAQAERDAIDVGTLTAEKGSAVLQAALAQKTMAETQDFHLTPEERLRIEARLVELDATLPGLQQEVARLEVQAVAEADLQTRGAEAEERLAGIERQLQYWQRRLRVDTEIRTLLDAARGRALADLTERHLPALVSRALAAVTADRHADVRTGAAGLAVWSAAKGAALDEEELSTGTRDQFYLVLRLAHLEALFPTNRPPLLLDDPLVHCDPARRAAVLQLLADYAVTGQVLLFTCHVFPEYDAYPILAVAP